jgi:L-methionine (R)-S-oxide reductase
MHVANTDELTSLPLARRYERIYQQLVDLCASVPSPLARMATAVALLHHKLPHFLWTGFYLLAEGELVVGPYQGSLACLRLPPGQGVCWACLERRASIIVPDVDAFPGHIACDSRSQSEVVVPLWAGSELRGVLDVDSAQPAAFTATDAAGLAQISALIFAARAD